MCEFWEVTRPVGDWVSQELSLMGLTFGDLRWGAQVSLAFGETRFNDRLDKFGANRFALAKPRCFG